MPHTSLVDQRLYTLDPPRIEWEGRWYSAHLVVSTYGTALVPDDPRLPIAAIAWVEYAPTDAGAL